MSWWRALAAASTLVLGADRVRLDGQSMAGGGSSGLIWPAGGRYAGSSRCALCHADKARSFHSNSMSRALEPIDNCEILKQNPRLEWSDGKYSYLIARKDNGYLYRVSSGTESEETRLLYAFGQGKAGQTYVFQADGQYYESRVSYYKRLKGLALTVGAMNVKPSTIRQALGRIMSPGEARDCFGCHTTGARHGNELQLANYENGVQCEDCHGPGAAHADSMAAGKPGPIRGLRGLSAEETSDVCGSCHRTWETVMLMRVHGVNNVRFQPYRLTNSKCFLSGDPKIACTACHDPHSALEKDAKFYDAKCTACHDGQKTVAHAKTCPVGKEACVSCHMPRYEVPGSNHAFADHWIRVARRGEAYPD